MRHLVEIPDRRRGRPRIEEGEPSTSINVRVTTSMYDAACKMAARTRISLPELVRQAIRHLLEDERG